MRRVVFVLILLSILATTAHAVGGRQPHGGRGLPDLRAAVEANTNGVAQNGSAAALNASTIATLEGALADLVDRVLDLEDQPVPEASAQLTIRAGKW